WRWRQVGQTLELPMPAMVAPVQLRNAACAIAALQSLDIPIDDEAYARGVAQALINGRLQRFDVEGVEVVVDVGHNPQAARALATWLDNQPRRATSAVYAALADKDAAGVVAELAGQVDAWHVAGLFDARPRGEDVEAFAIRLQGTAAATAMRHADVQAALQVAIQQAQAGGRVLVFGSFHTAAAALRALNVTA
nr:bifunctional folylpolyglutamate synthase/dihydrofolate synthase [Pseudomonadota bacterium]